MADLTDVEASLAKLARATARLAAEVEKFRRQVAEGDPSLRHGILPDGLADGVWRS